MTDTASTRPRDEEYRTMASEDFAEHLVAAASWCAGQQVQRPYSDAAYIALLREAASRIRASLPEPTAGSTGELDLLDLLRKAGASEKDAKPFTRTIWKDSIDIDEPTYVLEKFAKLLIEAATGPAQSTAEVDRCNICGLVVDLRYKAEKPSIEFGMAGRAKTKAPPASTPAQSGLVESER